MRLMYILILLALNACSFASASGSVVINEVELDYIEDDAEIQWVEIYNNGEEEVDVSGWAIMSSDDRSRKEFIDEGTLLSPGDFYLMYFGEKWLSNYGAVIILEDDFDHGVDRTISIYDSQEDGCAWGKYPDGASEWMFMESTPGAPNSGVQCDVTTSKAVIFNMDGSVSGRGYLNLQNRGGDPVGGSFISHEHGSGDYSADSSFRMDINDVINVSRIDLKKDALSMRYNRTFNGLPGNRTVYYDSLWAESSSIKSMNEGGEDGSMASQSTTYGNSISKDVVVQSKYGSLKMKLSSDSVGRTNVEYCSDKLKLSEEYLGGFHIEETITKGEYQRAVNSTDESGYVDVYKKVGEDYSSYERGSGLYQAEEIIEAGDYARKNVILDYMPAGYSYSNDSVANRSHMWEEGFGLNATNGLYAEEHYTNLAKLEKEVEVKWPNEVRTSSSFIGQASLKSVFRRGNNSTDLALLEDDYIGDYKIDRTIFILPKYDSPHMSVYKQGYVDPDRCDVLRFAVTVVNDGNRTFAPIYVRDTFPSGTRFIGSSVEPMELARTYGNWSIPALGSGDSFTIDMQFKVITRKENYTNRARANTIYVYSSRGTPRERKLRVSNSTTLDLDWSGCPAELLPLDFTATLSPVDEKIVSYRLILNNTADYTMSANITALLPEGMSFINSTTATLENDSGVVKWSIRRIDAGRRRTVSFMAGAEREGLFEVKALVSGSSTEGNESISTSSSALVVVGKPPRASNIESLQSMQWLPCGDSALYQSLAKVDAGSRSEIKCCSW